MSEAPILLDRARSPRLDTPLRLMRSSRVTHDARREPNQFAPLQLIYRAESGGQVRLAVGEELVTVGAHPGNDVVVDDAQTSGFHCRLFRHVDGRLWARDLGSTNGT